MFARLYFLAHVLVSSGRLLPSDASTIAADARLAAVEVGASEDDAALALTWMAHESAGRAGALGDRGRACGATQLHASMRRGASCAELLSDRVLAARVWLEDLADLRARCGSTERALGALATGVCGGAPGLVRARMNTAGVSRF